MAQISRELGLDPPVKSYLSMTAEQYQKYLDQQKTLTKELYEEIEKPMLKPFPAHRYKIRQYALGTVIRTAMYICRRTGVPIQ